MAAVYCKEPGTIADNEGNPLPQDFIAHELHCPVELLKTVIEKGESDNCLKDTDKGLVLINFKEYQFTEYDRQKPYRQAKRGKDAAAVNKENEERIAQHKAARKQRQIR